MKPPLLVFPDKFVSVSGISIRNLNGAGGLVSSLPITISISLGKETIQGNSVVATVSATLNGSDWSYPTVRASLGALSPASDFKWSLKLVQPAITDVIVTLSDSNVSVLDVSPVIQPFSTSDIMFSGSNISIDCLPMTPAKTFFIPLFTASNVTTTACEFNPVTTGLSIFRTPAQFVSISETLIQLRCEALSRGQLGPPYSKWKFRVLFPDGRESPESSTTLNVRCPPGMYIENNSTSTCKVPPCCLDCPQPMSMSATLDSIGIQSCVCQPGYYGFGGLACIKCPTNAVYGFKCTSVGLQFPLVKPGFYIDYSLLSTCTEESCKAVVRCPNAQACPGGGQKNCLNIENECYSNRSMGCTECCLGYYSDNFVCKKCPESRLLVVLCLAILLLIVFAILSSSLTFPPFVAVAKGSKLILSGLQSFSCIRLMAGLSSNDGVLSGVNWPDIMLSTFEVMNTFTFSFDSLRPQCSLDFSPLEKLILVTVGPYFVVSFILLMAVSYSFWKIGQICAFLKRSKLLSERSISNYTGLFRSVASCFLVSTLCLKYSRNDQIVHGPLWPALDPNLIGRSDLSVITTRRRQSVSNGEENANHPTSSLLKKLPGTWRKMIHEFDVAGVSRNMKTSTATARLLISSAFSIFILTFQGVLETMLSTWDCKIIENRKFLRSRPNVECTSDNSEYSKMVGVSSVGLTLYILVVPLCVILIVRSRWAREIYAYSFVEYDHLFGFITSQYTSSYVSWEAINCVRKLFLVAIPMVIASSPITQSLSNIVLFLLYAMCILALKPMTSAYLNKIEVINSFNIVVTSFAAMLFTVQYENKFVLQGYSREIVGMALVTFISLSFLAAIRLISFEFNELYALHGNPFLSKWLRIICAKAGSSIVLGQYLPISLLFINKTSRKFIQNEVDAGDNTRQKAFTNIHKVWFSSNVVSRLIGYFVLAWTKAKLWVQNWRYLGNLEIGDGASQDAMAEPDFEFFMLMHKLLQRTRSWEPHERNMRNCEFLELPKMFTVNYGKSDPPIAVCDSLLRTSRAVDEILNQDHQKLLLAILLHGETTGVRPNLDNGKSEEYKNHMLDVIGSFKKLLFKNIQASELFRDASESNLDRAVCRPLRRRLYGAAESERIKMLHLIASTTLPQFRQLQSTQNTSNMQISPSANPLKIDVNSQSRRSSRIDIKQRRGTMSSSLSRPPKVASPPENEIVLELPDKNEQKQLDQMHEHSVPSVTGANAPRKSRPFSRRSYGVTLTPNQTARGHSHENESNHHFSEAPQILPQGRQRSPVGPQKHPSDKKVLSSFELEEIVIDKHDDSTAAQSGLKATSPQTRNKSLASTRTLSSSLHGHTQSQPTLVDTLQPLNVPSPLDSSSTVRDVSTLKTNGFVVPRLAERRVPDDPALPLHASLPIKNMVSSKSPAILSIVTQLAPGSSSSMKSASSGQLHPKPFSNLRPRMPTSPETDPEDVIEPVQSQGINSVNDQELQSIRAKGPMRQPPPQQMQTQLEEQQKQLTSAVHSKGVVAQAPKLHSRISHFE
jgi:hypothetical protein